MNLNFDDYKLNSDGFDLLYSNFYGEEWTDAQDALVDLIAYFEKYLSSDELNKVA